jgi:hypothetical protein
MADDPAVLALMARLPVDHIAEDGTPMVLISEIFKALRRTDKDKP